MAATFLSQVRTLHAIGTPFCFAVELVRRDMPEQGESYAKVYQYLYHKTVRDFPMRDRILALMQREGI